MSHDGAGSPPHPPFKTEGSVTLMQYSALLSRLLGEHAPMALVMLDVHNRLLWTNASFLALLESAEHALVGKRLADVLRLVSWLPEQRLGDVHSFGHRWQRTLLTSEALAAPKMVLMAEMIPEGAPAGVAKLLAFVDLRGSQGEEIPPFSDPHTGLASQWVFEDRLRHAMERSDRHDQPLSLMLARLDGTDALRRSIGESIMQALRVQISRRLTSTLRGEDSVAYLGDDRWAVLIEYPVSPESLQAAAMRCLEVMEAPFSLGRPPLLMTLSIGIALYPNDADSSERLIELADQASKRAKPSSHVFFDRRLKERLSKRVALRQCLQEALLRPERHFVIAYQPQFDLATGGCVGVEALVRWRHPRRGMVLPDEFLPMVAEMEQMIRLDRWVIERVVAQHQRWREEGAPLSTLMVSVNIDASLLDQDIFDGHALDRFLRERCSELGWLALEIDGKVLSGEVDAHSLLLRRLSRMGVKLVVDDLGVAPVDLIRLAMLPVSQGKIGRELVRGLTDSSPFARQAASALSQCLKALALGSAMVGIESREELAAARRKGVEQVQGNLLGVPMTADALTSWLAEGGGSMSLEEP